MNSPLFVIHYTLFVIPDRRLKLDSLLGVNTGVKRMLDLLHLGNEIGGLDQLRRGVAAGSDDVQVRLFFADGLYFFEHLLSRRGTCNRARKQARRKPAARIPRSAFFQRRAPTCFACLYVL